MVKKKKQTWPKSCSKLKHRHPQNKKRICNLHPQNLERMNAEQEETQDTNK